MKNLSTSAKQHPKKTILLLVLLHTLLNYFYFYTGTWLYLEGIKTPSVLTIVATSLFLAAWLFYPIKNAQQGIYKTSFLKKKCWQGITMVSVAIFFIHGGNHLSRAAMAPQTIEFSAENIVLDLKANQHLQKKKTRKERRSLRKLLRKRLRANIKTLRQMKGDLSKNEKVGIFILAILGALVLGLLVLALSCNLSCSGNEVLALIVLVGGGILIITGLVLIYRKLFIEPKIGQPKAEPIQG